MGECWGDCQVEREKERIGARTDWRDGRRVEILRIPTHPQKFCKGSAFSCHCPSTGDTTRRLHHLSISHTMFPFPLSLSACSMSPSYATLVEWAHRTLWDIIRAIRTADFKTCSPPWRKPLIVIILLCIVLLASLLQCCIPDRWCSLLASSTQKTLHLSCRRRLPGGPA